VHAEAEGEVLVQLGAVGVERLAVGEELVLQAPLVLPEDGARQVQVRVGEAGPDGGREVAVYSHSPVAGSPVVCHARGRLAVTPAPPEAFPAVWPPVGAVPVPVADLYARLAEAGYEYGPAFQGVRAAWRAGDTVYADVALPDGVPGFLVHPALLDAALHGALLDRPPGAAPDLPFSWTGVSLAGSRAAEARVRIVPAGAGGVRVDIADENGEPVAAVAGLTFRPVDPAQLGGVPEESLFHVVWRPLSDTPPPVGAPVRVVAAGADVDALDATLAEGAAAPDIVVAETSGDLPAALALVQRWLSSEWLTEARLVVMTRGAVDAGSGPVDPARAPVWGLVRIAQSEHPGRFVLVDVDGDEPDWAALAALDEPQLAVRDGEVLVPRLQRVEPLPVGEAWRLSIGRRGSLEDLAFVVADGDRPLAAHEVRWVCVRPG
jgi:acyl transferase domain-containing protein